MKIFVLSITSFFSLSILVFAGEKKSSVSPAPLSSVQQLLVVTTKDWDAVPGQLRRFERPDEKTPWREVGHSVPVVVGRNGLGWGMGLMTAPPTSKGPIKKEGDGKSPAGIFQLTTAFGLAETNETTWLKMPYRHLSETIECVDDVKSIYYNTIVDHDHVPKIDWTSSEKMRAIGEQYRWGIFIAHNSAPSHPGDGSCVFMHIWKNSQTGTAGCTAMTPENILRILRWLDAAQNPSLVQLPENEFEQAREKWGLPHLSAP